MYIFIYLFIYLFVVALAVVVAFNARWHDTAERDSLSPSSFTVPLLDGAGCLSLHFRR